MSTLKVTNIQATGETVDRVVSGIAAAWANYKGTTTNAIRDSVNISSVTDSGTGIYDFNFTNAFANDDYASPSAAANAAGSFRCAFAHDGDVVSTTSFRVRTENSSSTSVDSAYVHTEALGDLA